MEEGDTWRILSMKIGSRYQSALFFCGTQSITVLLRTISLFPWVNLGVPEKKGKPHVQAESSRFSRSNWSKGKLTLVDSRPHPLEDFPMQNNE